MTRAVYATVNGTRVGAQVDNANPEMVAVWLVGGGQLGGYRLDRFEGRKLTARTLAAVLINNAAGAAEKEV